MRTLALVLVLMVAPLAARAEDLHVYAGAGLREVVDGLARTFEGRTGLKVAVEYGGSGQLLVRIRESGKGDVFIPGSMMYIGQLERDGMVAGKRELAVHAPVLAVNKAAAGKVTSFADLARPGLRLALGDAKAMALGRTADAIVERSGMKDAILANVTVRAATVRQLALYVVNGDVDAAIVGGPELARNADGLIGVEIPAGLYEPEVAGVAVLTCSARPGDAEAFAALLASDTGRAAFAAAGSPPVGR